MGGCPVTVEGRTQMEARLKLAKALERVKQTMNMFPEGRKEIRFDHKKGKWVACVYVHS